MSKLSTKGTSNSGFVNKTILPGNEIVKVNSIILEKTSFKSDPESFYLILNVEGKEQPAPFEGFNIVKDDPSQGSYKGQIGRVKSNGQFTYADKTFKVKDKTGKEIDKVYKKDDEIMRFLEFFCKAIGATMWWEAQDDKHDTVESLIAQINQDKPFKDKWLRTCLGGKPYVNKGGYTNYDLHLIPYDKTVPGERSYESASVPEANSKVAKFNPNKHILVDKKKTETIESFEAVSDVTVNPPAVSTGDFDL